LERESREIDSKRQRERERGKKKRSLREGLSGWDTKKTCIYIRKTSSIEKELWMIGFVFEGSRVRKKQDKEDSCWIYKRKKVKMVKATKGTNNT
jgi:hypothetical protein